VKSAWCKRELTEFLRLSMPAGADVVVAGVQRVFKVVKTPLPPGSEPVELQSMLGYEFYTLESQSQRVRELGPLSPPEVLHQYRSKLDDLAHDIARLLTTLENEAHGRIGSHVSPQVTGAVYLAETSYELNDRRDAIRRELQSHGYVVLPDRPLPLFGPDCMTFVKSELERCRLSIHMVGNNYGVVPEGSMTSIIELQHELALSRSAAGNFCRLIWLPPDLAITDPRQQAFVAQLHSDATAQSGADLLNTPLEDFKTVLHVRLSAPDPVGSSWVPGTFKTIYVICDQRDRESVAPLRRFLHMQGFEVVLSAFEGDEASIRRDHEENLALCHAVLIYHGAGNEIWFRTMLRDLKKSAAYRTGPPLAAKAAYLAEPMTPDKLTFASHEVIVIRQGPDLTSGGFAPFFRYLH
jgi:hypothetical protein